ncbi:MAG: endospore germination permease [Ruminiclostridium sp.]|nr:endospore germination permease [Ruminiclostridium sp.]
MKLENQRISSNQLFYLVFAFLLGSTVMFLPGAMAGSNAWMAMLLGTLEGFIFLAIYNSLAGQHPGKNLIQINILVFGPFLGKALSWLYMTYFLYISAQILRTFAAFFAIKMTSTPLIVFLITSLLVSAFGVRSGLEVIARYSQIILMTVIFLFFLDSILLAKDMDISNFLPFMDIPINKMLLSIQSVAALPFGLTVVFLMIINLVSNPSETGSFMKKSFLFGGILLMLYTLRTTAVLGSYATISTYPAIATVRIINIGEIFTRLEILLSVVFLSLGFVKGSIFYYSAVLGVSQLLKMRSYRPLVFPIGALLLNISLSLYDEYIYDTIDTNMLFPFYSMIFALFLPLLTLIAAKIKKIGCKQEDGVDA